MLNSRRNFFERVPEWFFMLMLSLASGDRATTNPLDTRKYSWVAKLTAALRFGLEMCSDACEATEYLLRLSCLRKT